MHVGFHTSYAAYKEFLEKRIYEGQSAIQIIEKTYFFIPRDKDCWTDLESSLAFDYKKFITHSINSFDRKIDVNHDEICASQLNTAKEFHENNPRDITGYFTNEWLWKWISEEYYSHIDDLCNRCRSDMLHSIIDRDSVCINFNYTHTIEDMFGVHRSNVLYIHNRLEDRKNREYSETLKVDFEKDILKPVKKQFQFGSVNNCLNDWIKFADSFKIENDQNLINKDQIRENLKKIYSAFSKQPSNNYSTLAEFINKNITQITSVIVLGHSMLGVDELYYKDIIVPRLKHVQWDIYWHGSDSAVKRFDGRYKLPNVQFREW